MCVVLCHVVEAWTVPVQDDHNLSLVEYELVRLEPGADTESAAQPEAVVTE